MKLTPPLLLLALLVLLGVSCGEETPERAAPPPAVTGELQPAAPQPGPRRELRAAWVATVANIDWPSRPGLPALELRAETLRILDRLAELSMNAVIFQVRPHADALYDSAREPWSYYLTGEQGRAPEGGFDPLRFWIDEAHRRGIELHAWFNPYRAGHPAMRGEFSANSVVRQHPGLVVRLGNAGYYWMDPALQAVQDHTVAVVLDVVRRYDIDGVHFDDYFYPYRSYNDGRDFPDNASFAAYRENGGELDRDGFRRRAVDSFVQRIHAAIHEVKPHVKFGISPFGIWRPGHPRGIQGMDAYSELHADARRWLREGWVDYLMPQLYWPIAQVPQSFPILLAWWREQNLQGRHVWPGTMPRHPEEPANGIEMQNQVQIARAMLPESPGLCFYSMKTLLGDRHVIGGALQRVYKEPALIPASPWLEVNPPAAPALRTRRAGDALNIEWDAALGDIAHIVVSLRHGETWTWSVFPAARRTAHLPGAAKADEVLVSAVGRNGVEGPRIRIHPAD